MKRDDKQKKDRKKELERVIGEQTSQIVRELAETLAVMGKYK